jgi:hypothetical protein
MSPPHEDKFPRYWEGIGRLIQFVKIIAPMDKCDFSTSPILGTLKKCINVHIILLLYFACRKKDGNSIGGG